MAATLLALFLTLAAEPALAHLELNAYYSSGTMNTGSAETNTSMFIEGALGFTIDKKGQYLVGWGYNMVSTTEAGTGTTVYSSTQMGPRFLWFVDKSKNWSVAFAYYLVTSATYTPDGGTAEKWKGTGLKLDAGYNFPVNDSFSLGVRMNYSSATYIEKLTNDTTYEQVSYTNSQIYPSLYLVWLF